MNYYGNTTVVVQPKRKEIEEKRKEIEKKRNRIVEIYNSICTNLPQIQKLTDKRKKAIDNFLKEFTIEQFEQICNVANVSEFLTGKNNRNWKADFDFLMRVDKATAISEGKYSTVSNNAVGNAEEKSNNVFYNIGKEEGLF